MKQLTLLRHAKSSWAQNGLSDHDRPLNQRGRHDVPVMGRRLTDHGVRPSLIITSPAKRARQTVKLLAQEIGYPIEFLQTEKPLYLADPATILEVIGLQDDTFSDIIVCAHNPGITDLAGQLSGLSIDNLPTCGIVVVKAETDSWSSIATAPRELITCDYPKNPH